MRREDMDHKSLLVRGGTVVSDSSASQIDLQVKSGRIIAQGSPGSFDKEDFTEVIDASGMFVLPGLIDPHVHFDSPFMEKRFTIFEPDPLRLLMGASRRSSVLLPRVRANQSSIILRVKIEMPKRNRLLTGDFMGSY
jgi:predicted amidohydrolase YtcJ